MSWQRSQFKKVRRQSQHARASMCVASCCDCGTQLHVTHVLVRFGNRCRRCWSAFMRGAEDMASHEHL